MEKNKLKTLRRTRRRRGLRKRIFGTAERPRLAIFRSNKHIYAQLVDDLAGTTLASAGTVAAKTQNGGDINAAKQIGQQIAEKAKTAGIIEVAFDRSGFRYHGRVKALANAAREGGLKF